MTRTVVALLALVGSARPPGGQEPGRDAPVIRVAPEGWGDADREDIAKVLESAAEAFGGRLPGKTPVILEVSRSRSGPITLFERGPAGEIRMKLDVEGRHWAQFAFQFGHELGHVACGFAEYANPNLWFEETLCEAASLYVLGRMAESWKSRPPFPNWKEYAGSLAKYRSDRLEKARWPEGTGPAEWFRAREPSLRKDPRQRELNGVLASTILPLFEESPEHWESVGSLNTVRGDGSRTFRQYLQDWSRSSAEKHRGFIRKVAGKFGIDP